MKTLRISDIVIGPRFRKDMGDIDGLAASIADVGLLQAPGVTPAGQLVFGRRRLKACERLGWEEIPVRVVDIDNPLKAEHDENEHRLDFSPSERVAILRAIRDQIGDRRGERTDKQSDGGQHPENYPEVDPGAETREVAAKAAGFGSEFTAKAAETVVDHGVPELVEAMDRGEVTVSAAAEVAKLPKADQEKVVKAGPAAVKSAAKNQRAKKKEATGATKTKPAAKAEAGAETARPAGDGAGGGPADGGGGTPDGGHAAGDTGVAEAPPVAAKSRPVPTVDAWGIPIQEHAAEAFKAVPKFKELIALLRTVRGELTALCDSPGGRLLLRRCQFARADNKAGGRWVLAELDNAIGVMEDATPAHTDCPYHFNEFQPHGEKAEGRPCHLCDNKRFTGNLKRFQVPAPMLAAMREFYGVTEGA